MVGYAVIVVLASFHVWGATRSYDFACLPGMVQRRLLSVTEAEAEGKREVGENFG